MNNRNVLYCYLTAAFIFVGSITLENAEAKNICAQGTQIDGLDAGDSCSVLGFTYDSSAGQNAYEVLVSGVTGTLYRSATENSGEVTIPQGVVYCADDKYNGSERCKCWNDAKQYIPKICTSQKMTFKSGPTQSCDDKGVFVSWGTDISEGATKKTGHTIGKDHFQWSWIIKNVVCSYSGPKTCAQGSLVSVNGVSKCSLGTFTAVSGQKYSINFEKNSVVTSSVVGPDCDAYAKSAAQFGKQNLDLNCRYGAGAWAYVNLGWQADYNSHKDWCDKLAVEKTTAETLIGYNKDRATAILACRAAKTEAANFCVDYSKKVAILRAGNTALGCDLEKHAAFAPGKDYCLANTDSVKSKNLLQFFKDELKKCIQDK